jgi:hypothetical protein
VGANCRGLITADAIGWLELGPEWTLEEPGEGKRGEDHTRKDTKNSHKHTQTPGFTQVQGPREEVRPLLLLVCTKVDDISSYKGCSLSCIDLSEFYSNLLTMSNPVPRCPGAPYIVVPRVTFNARHRNMSLHRYKGWIQTLRSKPQSRKSSA